MQLILLEVVKSNRDSVRAEQEKHISLKEVKPLNLVIPIRKIKLVTFLLHQVSMFRSFVLFIAAHYYFSDCNVCPYF